jgi:23S rRNA (adenine2503-C2)-methyltransferase
MFGGLQLPLEELAKIADRMPTPISRKYTLNFAYASGNEIDGKKLASMFDTEKFMCKITPIHNNNACKDNNIELVDGYTCYSPYEEAEQSLMAGGFDVLVFIPSLDEDDELVTCGNAITGGSELKVETEKVRIIGQ